MAKKVKFNIDFTEDNNLIGISCHKRDYWIAFHVNEKFGIQLRRLKDFPFYKTKIKAFHNYPLFHAFLSDEQLGFYMIGNYNPDGALFPELKTTDYFIIVQGRVPEKQKTVFLSDLRSINGVLTAFLPDTSKLKEYDNFLTDLELHMTSMQTKG